VSLTFFESTDQNYFGIYDKYFVAVLIIIVYILGLSLAFYPGWYKKRKKAINKKKVVNKIVRNRIGHHPDCEQFKNHILKFKNKTFCAGCFGLAIGSIISITLVIIYLLISVNYTAFNPLILIIGFIFVFQIYLEIIISKRNSIVHMFSNILHVTGFILIAVSILEITNSVPYTIITILFSFLFFNTRVQLSLYNHNLECKKCKYACKMY
jgi:hypothetical protein